MDQILDEEQNKANLKKCLESFVIVQLNEQKQSKKNLYQYLQKRHYEMNNDNRFTKNDNKHTHLQNLPLKKSKNISSSALNPINSQKTLRQESMKENYSEKTLHDEPVKQEYEVIQLIRNEKHTFRARISAVYLDQPLIMIIFENQEIVKNNTKLKKQLAVSNNVLLNFFQEVNTKCNILKSLIFNNEIFNAKFLFQLLQNNIYSIEQYLRKRGIDSTQRQNSISNNFSYLHQMEASSFSPQSVKKQILKFQIFQEQKIVQTTINLSKLFTNINNKSKQIIKKSLSNNTNQDDYMKRFSNAVGETTYQVSNVSSTQVLDEFKPNEGKIASNSNNELELESETSLSNQKLDFFEEQNDFDYIDRIKINGNYNLDSIFSRKTINKQLFQVYSNSSHQLELQEKITNNNSIQNSSNHKIPEKDDIQYLQQDHRETQNHKLSIQDNKHNKKSQSAHKISINNNTSTTIDKQTNISQNLTFQLNQSNNNITNHTSNNQLLMKNLSNNSNNNNINNNNFNCNLLKKQQNDLYLNPIKSNSNVPSFSNVSIQQSNQPILQSQERSLNQEGITLTEINVNTQNSNKVSLRKIKSHINPQNTQEFNRGNIKQFEFGEVLEDINIFKNEINMKWECQLQQIKLISDKDMIVYILRSLLSSILVINSYRKSQTIQYKLKTLNNLNQSLSPELNIKRSLSRANFNKKQSIKLPNQTVNEMKQIPISENEQQFQSQYSQNLEFSSFQYPINQIDNRQLQQNKREASPVGQNQQLEVNQVTGKPAENSIKLQKTSSSPQNYTKPLGTINQSNNLEFTTNENNFTTKGNSNKSRQSQNTNETIQRKDDDPKRIQLINSMANKNNEDRINENKKSNFIQNINNKERSEIKGTLEDNQSQHVNFAEIKSENSQEQEVEFYGEDADIDIPFNLYEVEVDFSLEKNKYCKSIIVNINNINKQELMSCLNLNTNKDVSKTEYEIIKLIIQKIGPYPLCYEARRVSFAFLLDLSEIIDGQSFFNLPYLDNQINPSQQQEQILYQIPEEDGDIPQSIRKKHNIHNNDY